MNIIFQYLKKIGHNSYKKQIYYEHIDIVFIFKFHIITIHFKSKVIQYCQYIFLMVLLYIRFLSCSFLRRNIINGHDVELSTKIPTLVCDKKKLS